MFVSPKGQGSAKVTISREDIDSPTSPMHERGLAAQWVVPRPAWLAATRQKGRVGRETRSLPASAVTLPVGIQRLWPCHRLFVQWRRMGADNARRRRCIYPPGAPITGRSISAADEAARPSWPQKKPPIRRRHAPPQTEMSARSAWAGARRVPTACAERRPLHRRGPGPWRPGRADAACVALAWRDWLLDWVYRRSRISGR